MLYQATRQFGDFDNGIEIPHGAYVETDCVKWVARIGSFLRPLQTGEVPKPKVKIFTVTNTVEDSVAQIVTEDEKLIVAEEISDEETVAEKTSDEEIVETTPRRKLKPNIRRSIKED
jgi:hypothetical protein